jgi:ABC-2 type transport system permease protein
LSTAAQYLALGRRSIFNTLRQPTAVVPSMTFPLIFLALNSAALGEAVSLPGFPPVDSFLQFMFATTVVQGTLFGSIAAGSDIANDIEGGFFERLIAAPTSRTSLLVGRLSGSAVFAFVQAWLFYVVATLFGLEVEGGLIAMFGVSIVCSILAVGVGAIAMAFGLRTGSAEAVQGSFPLLFALLFLSSAFFPRELMSGWFRDVANLNPFSHLIEALRYQVIEGLDVSLLVDGAAIALSVFAVGLTLSALALRRRLSEAS